VGIWLVYVHEDFLIRQFSPVKIHDIGRIIRESKKAIPTTPMLEGVTPNEVSTDRNRPRPRPHPRRGHWHHFWTGPGADIAARKLVLKWVAPTFVGTILDDDPAIINIIKKD
jgi:hypothetical protein